MRRVVQSGTDENAVELSAQDFWPDSDPKSPATGQRVVSRRPDFEHFVAEQHVLFESEFSGEEFQVFGLKIAEEIKTGFSGIFENCFWKQFSEVFRKVLKQIKSLNELMIVLINYYLIIDNSFELFIRRKIP